MKNMDKTRGAVLDTNVQHYKEIDESKSSNDYNKAEDVYKSYE
jgi:hypothetical protein